MRETKFRCWDKVHKEFLKIDEHMGCFLWGDEEFAIPPDRKASSGVSLVSPCQPDKGQDYFGSMSSTFFGDDLILIQYTGLKDCKGVEIFEGDIVKDRWGRIKTIRYDEEKATYIENSGGDNEICKWYKEYEVIGNIYSNPELLKGV